MAGPPVLVLFWLRGTSNRWASGLSYHEMHDVPMLIRGGVAFTVLILTFWWERSAKEGRKHGITFCEISLWSWEVRTWGLRGRYS